jgi:hypothetical protein
MTFRNAGEMQFWMDIYKAAASSAHRDPAFVADRGVEALRQRLPDDGRPAGCLWPRANAGGGE